MPILFLLEVKLQDF